MPNELLDEHAFQSVEPSPKEPSQKEKDLLRLKIYSIAFFLIICIFFVYIKYYYPIRVLGVELNPKEEAVSEGESVTIALAQMVYLCLCTTGAIIFIVAIVKTLRNNFLGALGRFYKNTQQSPLKKDPLFIFYTFFLFISLAVVAIPLFMMVLACISLVLLLFLQCFGQFGEELSIYWIDIIFYIITLAVFGLLYFLFQKQIRD